MDGTVVKEGLTVGGVRASRGSSVILARSPASGGICKLTSEATSRFDHLARKFITGR